MENSKFSHVYNIDTNYNGIKNALTRNILSKVAREMINANIPMSSLVQSALKVTYESLEQRKHINKHIDIIIESVKDTIDTMLVNFTSRNGYVLEVFTESEKAPEEGDLDENVADEIMKEENGDELSSVVTDIIESAIEGSREQMKQAVKLALKVEKNRQEDKFEEKKEEADEFGDFDLGEDEASKDEGESTDTENKEGDEENEKDNGEDKSSDDESKDDSKKSDDEDNKEVNPFDEGDSKEEEKTEEKKEDKSEEEPAKKEDEEVKNPFESIIADTFDDLNIFTESLEDKYRITPGQLHNFTNEIMTNYMMEDMKSVYDQYGPESVQMTEMQDNYKRKSNMLMENLVKNIIFLESIGITIDTNIIKYPEIYFNK